jgi:hypothetical protein
MLLSKLPTRIVCIAAVISLVAGCSSGSWSPTHAINMQQGPTVAMTATQRPPSVQTEGFLNGEVFKASKVVIQTQSCSTGNFRVTFSATGSASGPYPGTFTETGDWWVESDYYDRGWGFRGPFQISSQNRLIKGRIYSLGRVRPGIFSCHRLGRSRDVDTRYRVGKEHKTGSASVNLITANGLMQTFL